MSEYAFTYRTESGELETQLVVPDGYHPPSSIEYAPYAEGADRVRLRLVEPPLRSIADVGRRLNAILGLIMDWERGEGMVDDLTGAVLSAVEGRILTGDDVAQAASDLIEAREHVRKVRERR